MFNFNEYLQKNTFNALQTKDPDGFYFIRETGELFLGENPYGVSVEILETSLPASGTGNKLYVVRNGATKGIYTWNGTTFEKLFDLGIFITADSVSEFSNKTLDLAEGKGNSVKNADLGIFNSSAIEKTITSASTDETITTAKAVYDFVINNIGSALNYQGGADMSAVGTTFNTAKKGYAYTITHAGEYLTEDFNIGDMIIFVKNVSGSVKAGDFIKIDNTESPNILRKISGVNVNELVSFTADGGIKSSGLTATSNVSDESTDKELVTAKTIYNLFKIERV